MNPSNPPIFKPLQNQEDKGPNFDNQTFTSGNQQMFPTFEATQLQSNANNKGNTPNQQQFVEKSTQNKDKQNVRLDP